MSDRGVHGVVAEQAAFLEGGVAILVGSADAVNVPHAARAWGATVLDGGSSVRLLLPSDASVLWANLRATGELAVCFTDVATYRSIQVKGRVRALAEAATPDDMATWERYRERFFSAVEVGSGVPRSMVSRLAPAAVQPAVLEVSEAYEQTPGPVAGRSLGGEPS